MSVIEIAYVALSVLAAFLIEVVLFLFFCKDLDTKKPCFTIAWLAALFSVGSIITLITLNVGKPQASAGRNWFSSGWTNSGIYLFNIPINSWQSYSMLMVYQISRTIIGALVTNIYRTYISVNILGAKRPLEKERFFIMLGYAATTAFNYWVSVTDIFIILTQWPFTIVALVSQIASDSLCIYLKLGAGKVEEERPPAIGKIFDRELND
jgi:hypothetical protein